MILLDTNVISELMKAEPNTSVLDWVDQQAATELYVSAITKAEIEWGIGLLQDGKSKQQLQAAAVEIFQLFEGRCLNYSCDAATRFVEIAQYSKRVGRPMSIEDMLIAAIAQSTGCLLVTRNIADFDFLPDLQLFNPWNSP